MVLDPITFGALAVFDSGGPSPSAERSVPDAEAPVSIMNKKVDVNAGDLLRKTGTHTRHAFRTARGNVNVGIIIRADYV